MSVAALGMYDWPEVRAETDQLWVAIRDGLRGLGLEAPDALDRNADLWSVWRDPALSLSQTCGLPFAAKLSGRVSLLGAPVYDLANCPRGTYRSEIVVRASDPAEGIEDLRGLRFGFNARTSQSGWACFATQIAEPGAFFRDLVETGSHRNSVLAVADERADVACVDAVSWRLAQRHEPEATGDLRVLARTEATPGLPFITSVRDELELSRMRLIIETAIETLPPAARDAIFLKGFAKMRESDYAPLAAGWPDA